MIDLEIKGADQLETLARRLKDAGDGDLRKELLRGIRESNRSTIAAIRESARSTLPASGGLAALIARSPISTQTRLTGKSAGVRIRAKNAISLTSLNRGRLRHPVFGNRAVWVQQTVPEGWFDQPIEDDKDKIRRDIVHVMDRIADKIERKL